MSDALFIGTSDAFGAGGRRQSALLLRGGRGNILVDCGTTTNTGLSELGISRDEVDTILVSHFHGDHFGGIPLILLGALYEDGRKHPLNIAGPPEIEGRVRRLADAMGHPIEGREWTFPLTFTEIDPGRECEVGPARVSAFSTCHQLEANPQGYRIDNGEATVVYSGDTGWFDDLPRLTGGADLFICECTLHHEKLDFHLNLDQLTERHELFDCGRMVLTHLGSEMAKLRGEISTFETADDGMLIKL
jgi:ribonuclease BN (tRNA processing enzyme)